MRNLAPGHLGFHRTSEETLCVGFVMEFVDVFEGWLLVAREHDLRIHRDLGEPGLPVFSFLQVTNGVVFIAVDDEAAHGGNGEKCQHVAAGEGGGEGFLRIDAVWAAEEFWSRRRLQALATAGEVPLVVAWIILIAESSVATFPGESRFVFTHGDLSPEKAPESKRIIDLDS